MSRCMLKSYAHTCADSILMVPVCACCTYFVSKPLGLLSIMNHGHPSGMRVFLVTLGQCEYKRRKSWKSRKSTKRDLFCVQPCLAILQAVSKPHVQSRKIMVSGCCWPIFGVSMPCEIFSTAYKLYRLNGAFSPELRCSPVQLPGQVPG